ncbi:hypothetical protein AGLY_005457, partial [Aphis glycines]
VRLEYTKKEMVLYLVEWHKCVSWSLPAEIDTTCFIKKKSELTMGKVGKRLECFILLTTISLKYLIETKNVMIGRFKVHYLLKKLSKRHLVENRSVSVNLLKNCSPDAPSRLNPLPTCGAIFDKTNSHDALSTLGLYATLSGVRCSKTQWAYTASNILNPGTLCDAFNSLYFLSIHIPRQKLEIPTTAKKIQKGRLNFMLVLSSAFMKSEYPTSDRMSWEYVITYIATY